MKIKTCCWPADCTNAVDCTFLFFNKEPDQSESFHKRKRWACWVYLFRDVKLRCVSSDVGWKGSHRWSPWKPHEVTKNTSYRMWNTVTMSNDGLLLLNPSNGNVHCNRSFSGGGSKFPFLMCFLSFFTRLPGSKDLNFSQSAIFCILSRSKLLL